MLRDFGIELLLDLLFSLLCPKGGNGFPYDSINLTSNSGSKMKVAINICNLIYCFYMWNHNSIQLRIIPYLSSNMTCM